MTKSHLGKRELEVGADIKGEGVAGEPDPELSTGMGQGWLGLAQPGQRGLEKPG